MRYMDNLFVYLLIILHYSLLMFFLLRIHISTIINYKLNTSKRKKLKKNQNFFDWFLYKRYKNVIPKVFSIWYFGFLITFVLSMISVIILFVCKIEYDVVITIIEGIMVFMTIPEVISLIILGGYKDDRLAKMIGRNKRNEQ